MNYLIFDLLAVALPAGLLLLRAPGRRGLVVPVLVLACLAGVWTAPWDRYLVRTGVWSYDHNAVLGVLGSVPVEEFGFIVLEVLLVAAWTLHAAGWSSREELPRSAASGFAGAALWLAVGAVGGALLFQGGHLRYLGLLLVWVALPFALQQAFAHDVLVGHRSARLLRAAPIALWLCGCDRLALALGIWTINPASSTGVTLFGLPLEEALFFWLTCLLTADGLLLATHPVVLLRVRSVGQSVPRTFRTRTLQRP